MKLAYDSRAGNGLHGIARYTRSLLAALREQAPERGAEILETSRPRRADVYHSPWIDGAPLRPRCPSVVTLHDLIPLKRPGEYLRSGLRFRMRYLAVQRATRVIVPTRAVARDANQLLGIPRERLAVITYAADAVFYPRSDEEVERVRRRLKLPAEYLLWVGGLLHPDPRKRVAALAEAARDVPLVLAGDPGQWARELPGVHLTGGISDEDLAAVYTGAHALVFPSDEEGFGLPPVEALACGTPVVACDAPALREVLGDRATFVEVGDFDGLVEAGRAARRPAPKLPEWTWGDTARLHWETYEAAVTAVA
jgi:glycosyltransferase involved in cell wall biosynthesis